MHGWLADATLILVAVVLVALNGFFVAAEFALVKLRPSQIDAMILEGRLFAKTAKWLADRLDASLSACQLGITMASLGLGWVGEPVHRVPENMPISKVLRHFQLTHQLLAFVVDEYGTTIGIVTLENVLESIVGPVEDEFDSEQPRIAKEGSDQFLVLGSTPIRQVEKELGINLDDEDVDTLAGVLMSRSGKLPEVGDIVEFEEATAEILSVDRDHAASVRFKLRLGDVAESQESNRIA